MTLPSTNLGGASAEYEKSFYANDNTIYEAELSAGFYDTESLEKELMEKMNQVKITNIYTKQEPTTDIVTDNTIMWGKTISKVAGKCHNFYVDINPYNSKVLFINRLESIIPVTIETITNIPFSDGNLGNSSYSRTDDILKLYFEFIFYSQAHFPPDILQQLSPEAIYFTLPVITAYNPTCPDVDTGVYRIGKGNEDWSVYNQQLEDMRTGYTGLPFVPTNFPSIGGFSAEQINNKEYYPIHNQPDGWSGGTYEYDCCLSYFTGGNTSNNPDWVISSYVNNAKYLINTNTTHLFLYRFRLNIHDTKKIESNSRELFILDDKLEYIKYSVNKITNTDSNVGTGYFLIKGTLTSLELILSQVIGENLETSLAGKKLPRIGRAMPFKFEIQENDIFDLLAWPKPTCDLITISDKCIYQGIQFNTDAQLTNKIKYYTSGQIDKTVKHLNIELVSPGVYIFRGPRYVFLKINFPDSGDIVTNFSKTFSKVKDSKNLINNQNLFTKIMLPIVPSTIKNNAFVDNMFYLLDDVLSNVDSLNIQFINADGSLVDMNTEHNFTLKIVERKNVLKNTLINSKTNQVNTLGHNYYASNPNF